MGVFVKKIVIYEVDKLNKNSSTIVGWVNELLKVTGQGVGVEDTGYSKLRMGNMKLGLGAQLGLRILVAPY